MEVTFEQEEGNMVFPRGVKEKYRALSSASAGILIKKTGSKI